ncbi:MAG: FxsA family protein [Mariprofundales bacterium]
MFLRIFLLLFICLPLLELYVLIHVGSEIGGIVTILLCLFTAAAGGLIVRTQGIRTLLSARHDLEQGILPAQQILHGFLLVIAGISLFIPGFVSDVIGFLLLFPLMRNLMIYVLVHKKGMVNKTQNTTQNAQQVKIDKHINAPVDKIIDAEIVHEEKIK